MIVGVVVFDVDGVVVVVAIVVIVVDGVVVVVEVLVVVVDEVLVVVVEGVIVCVEPVVVVIAGTWHWSGLAKDYRIQCCVLFTFYQIQRNLSTPNPFLDFKIG